MNENIREVMYVGRKPRKIDNVTKVPGRVWNGIGDVVKVTAMEAVALAQHPAIWTDVTGWPEAKRIKTVAELQEQIRAEKRKLVTKVSLDVASEEQLERELERRRELRAAMPPLTESAPSDIPPVSPNEVNDDDTGDPAERPLSPAEVQSEIVGAILTLDPGHPEKFDKNGNPTVQAVQEVLGYDITPAELKAALKEINK